MTYALRVVACSSKPSPRLLKALAPFSLVVRQVASGMHIPDKSSTARALHTSRASCDQCRKLATMPGGRISLLRGQSGCGKSTLLRTLAATLDSTRARVIDANACLQQIPSGIPIVDIFSLPIVATLRLLSVAGLGEAMLWARTPGELSEGQRTRLVLAIAMAKARSPRPTWILLDEFCSTLDRVSACCVARTLRRWSRQANHVRIVCATAHDDIAVPLEPDLIIEPHAQLENT